MAATFVFPRQLNTQRYSGGRFRNFLSLFMLTPLMSLYRTTTTSMYRVTSAGKQRIWKSETSTVLS